MTRAKGTLRSVVVALTVGLLLSAPGCSQPATSSTALDVSPAELEQRLRSDAAPVVIDVRSAEEFSEAHVPGAINIPFDQVAARISEVDAPHGVALYCMIGPRARKGEDALLAAGYTSVLHLDGGLAAWKQAGLPVEDGP